MNLYLTKVSRSYVKGVMRYQGGWPDLPPPLVSDVVPKPLVSEGLTKFHCQQAKETMFNKKHDDFRKMLSDPCLNIAEWQKDSKSHQQLDGMFSKENEIWNDWMWSFDRVNWS